MGVERAATPRVERARAEELGREVLRAPPGARVRRSELVVRELEGALTLVWEVSVADHDGLAIVRAGGLRAGIADAIDDRVFETQGSVSAWVAVGGAPGAHGVPQQVPQRDTTVRGGSATTMTGGDGHFTLEAQDGASVSTTVAGRAARVVNSGGQVTASAPAAAMVDLVLGAGGDERVLAQTTAYHHVTAVRSYAIDSGAPEAALGAALTTNVNLAQTCNAYYSPGGRTINFFRSGGGCNNSAEASIVVHEYGHFLDDALGGISNGGLSEGWGDLLACFALGQAVVGGDLFQSGEGLRTCDNDYRYPASGYDEVHNLGQAWAGFAWHARAGLIAALGAEQGDALARALVMPSLVSNAPTIPAAVREVFLRDDDDGDLSNKTPHWDILIAAADRHGLRGIVDRDMAPPGRIDDLAAATTTSTSVTVTWTAPGDDGDSGTAARYELRWSTQPIDEASFGGATAAAAPAPLPAGQMQTTTVHVPPAERVYVAIRAIDELNNTGKLSNVLAVDLPAATAVFHDGAEDGLGAWEASGMWHVTQKRAGVGTHAFWYGQEASGNYDTPGMPNAGTLVSPVIDLAGVAGPRLAWLEHVDVETTASYDLLRVEVFDVEQPSIAVSAGKVNGRTGGFVPRLLALDGFAGRKVRIRLSFDTKDSGANRTQGWFVDEVRILGDAAPAPVPAGLMINEVLADPPAGYDTNGDQMASSRGDEMVELVNVGTAALDLSGATLSDALAARVTFDAGTVLAPGQAMVVFGGAARAIPGVVTIASLGLFLNNDGDAIYVRRPGGELLAELTYGAEGGHDQSLTRDLDGDPEAAMVGHRSVSAQPASPGRRADGGAFGDGGTPAGRLLLNEVLADPPAGYDASGDGVASTIDDELVELINVGTGPLELGGATIADAVGVRGTFPAGTTLAPGEVLVVFGGGAPALPGVRTLVMGPLGLNNGGDTVVIRAADGEVLVHVAYGAEGGMDQSLTRAFDADPAAPMVGHRTVSSAPASPGRRIDGTPF
jgi:hypothetical protein